MRIQQSRPDYNFALAQCYVQLNKTKDAIIYFSNFIKARPKNIKGWKELIKCLYNAGYYEEAMQQVHNALKNTTNKPILIFYKAVLLFAMNKPKEGILLLESAMKKTPKIIKELVELEPSLLQNQYVSILISKYKNNRLSK